jgi:hypothetical protein
VMHFQLLQLKDRANLDLVSLPAPCSSHLSFHYDSTPSPTFESICILARHWGQTLVLLHCEALSYRDLRICLTCYS